MILNFIVLLELYSENCLCSFPLFLHLFCDFKLHKVSLKYNVDHQKSSGEIDSELLSGLSKEYNMSLNKY